jgi:ABC-2 type transport system permease protein
VSDRLRIPSPLATTVTIAALTWTRLLRGRALWVGLLIAVLPLMYAGAMRSVGESTGIELFGIVGLILAVLAPMFVGSSIGEEIEDRTTTYLWSRPVPRWAILAGKLLALAPLAAVIALVSWGAACRIAWDIWPSLQTCGALVAGAFAISFVAAGIATLAPRHGTALTIIYMLFFDTPLGVLPATVRELSVTHQVRTLAGTTPFETGLASAAIALTILSGVWILVAALRVRRLEA